MHLRSHFLVVFFEKENEIRNNNNTTRTDNDDRNTIETVAINKLFKDTKTKTYEMMNQNNSMEKKMLEIEKKLNQLYNSSAKQESEVDKIKLFENRLNKRIDNIEIEKINIKNSMISMIRSSKDTQTRLNAFDKRLERNEITTKKNE